MYMRCLVLLQQDTAVNNLLLKLQLIWDSCSLSGSLA
jgi:hypothetical protein